MKIKFMRSKRGCKRMGAKPGDILIVDVEYDWDPEKVIVLAVLKPGMAPSMSEYKDNLARLTAEELTDFLESK